MAEIDDYISEWHNTSDGSQTLHEFLGLTWEDYGYWIQHNALPPRK